MLGFGFHPEAAFDLEEIWEYTATDNVDAADGVIEDILKAIDILAAFPHQGYRRPNLTSRPLRFYWCVNMSLRTLPTRSPCGWLRYFTDAAAHA